MAFWNKEEDDKKGEAVVSGSSTLNDPGVLTRSTPAVSQKEASSSAEPKNLEDRFGKLRSALGPGTVIQGKLSFDTPVRIDGKLSGEIFSSRELIVGDMGEIDAVVEVASLIVQGKVRGNIKATERIELWAGGSIDGDIEAPVVVMEETARFTGNCKMGTAQKAVSTVVTKESSKDKSVKPDGKNASDDKVSTNGVSASVH
jgi:cytoskeletal protein CcmA (bactofilin family)